MMENNVVYSTILFFGISYGYLMINKKASCKRKSARLVDNINDQITKNYTIEGIVSRLP